MKLNVVLLSTALAASSLMTINAHADSTTRVAAASALGSVAGTAVGKSMGGNTGATIGAALGGAGLLHRTAAHLRQCPASQPDE